MGPFGLNDPIELRRQSLLLRLVSIAEAYVDSLFMELMGEQLANPGKLLSRAVAEVEAAATSNWSERIRLFRTLHDLSVTDCVAWPRVDAAIDARNSAAHGLGALTARLRKKRNLPQRLRAIEATVGGGRVHLSDASIRITSEACRDLVLELDART